MSDLEHINRKCEIQKGKSGYDRKYRKQVKAKLKKLTNLFKGEL